MNKPSTQADEQQAMQQAQAGANQALLDAVTNQRNAAMNQLAQAQASLRVAMGEVERLAVELEQARKPKRAPKPPAAAPTAKKE